MINCPRCGTENRDGSKFCNECGQLFAGVNCPMCGAGNARDDVHCADCGARLLPVESSAEEAIEPLADAPLTGVSEIADGPGLPDWLERLRDAPQEEDTSAPYAEAGETVELPNIGDTAAAPVASDDWLSRLRQAATIEPDGGTREFEPLIERGGPDSDEPPARSAPTSDGADGELPDWLAQLRQGLQRESDAGEAPLDHLSVAPELEPPADITETGGLSWLDAAATAAAGGRAASLSDRVEDEDERVDEPLLPDEGDSSIPAWLRELEPFSPDSLAGMSEPTDEFGEAPLAAEEAARIELPDWLEPAATSDEPVEADTGEEKGDGLARAQIPDWLIALRPDSVAASEAAVPINDEDIDQVGVLSGIRGVIPIELPMATPPDTGSLGGLLGVLPEGAAGADQFARVIDTIAPARPAPRAQARRLSVWRTIAALILVAAICVPMLTDVRLFDAAPAISPDAANALRVVNALSPGDAVVVAYDFDPSTAGEMEPIADTLIDHVMQREGRVIAVSLLPAGPAIAQRSLERVAALHPTYVYGARYLNLGYLPGQEAALRAFLAEPFGASRVDFTTGENASALPGLGGLASLDDVALIIELGAGRDTVRWWIEQIGSQTQVPILAGVSAAVEPNIRPYYEGEPRQLAGIVSGLAGAADYGILIAGRRVSAADLEALRWGTVVALLVILAGIVISPFVRRTGGSEG